MDPLLHSMNSTLNLTEEESSVALLPADVASASTNDPKHILIAPVLTENYVHEPSFFDQMGGHWKGRYPAVISVYGDSLFKVTFRCAGDKLRVLNKEPWHFQNHLVVFCSPSVLQNVTVRNLSSTPFWVQVYRLPFLSKSKMLATALGNIIGEFIDVHEESLDEGWGPFLRIRVRLPIDKPLLRGRMISLPRIKDDFWIDFRYERLPEFCFECGRLGHPFEKYVAFMERMDNGNDDDLEYGPWMKGAKLPTTGYDKYHFSKGNAWPLLTRLARKSLVSTIPNLGSISQPQPKILFQGESSSAVPVLPGNTNSASIPRHQISPSHTGSTPQLSPTPLTIPVLSITNATSNMAISTNVTPLIPLSLSRTSTLPINPSSTTSLNHIYTPDIGSASNIYVPIATYPPNSSTEPIHLPTNTSVHTTTPMMPTLFTNSSPITTTNCCNSEVGQENVHPNRLFKRHTDAPSMRQMLKRCRNQNTAAAAFPSSSKGDCSNQNVSLFPKDSDGDSDDSAEIALQSRKGL
uniref:Zinc knuckle CX2CX4HX4C domain-containing protein n=1 Tax=Cannabis sativa TaxID=3483 RepID=A0A803QLU3_CANSA